MKSIFFICIIIFICANSFAQKIVAYNTDDLLHRVSNKDTTYIVNFWATWCIPCLKELPEFINLNSYYQGKPIKVLMVSMNTSDEYPEKIEEFVNMHPHIPEVIWLNNQDIEQYRTAIDAKWSGQIPSTIIFDNKKDKRYIIEEITTEEEMKKIVE